MTKKLALISVSDKEGIVPFAMELVANDFEIISTGGTKNMLDAHGIRSMSVEEITHFPEMMDGRVKTLHPLIHGGLLGKRDNPHHISAMEKFEIPFVDLVCVNLYPFKETVQKEQVSEEEVIEQIDIGGPSMIRSASKNFEYVTVLVDKTDYDMVLSELREFGTTSHQTRKKLAAKGFRHTASYDALIATYFTAQVGEKAPEVMTVSYELNQSLRYGENNHQNALFYQQPISQPYSIGQARQLHGKDLSYNNIRDADAAIRLLKEYSSPTAVAIKHMNPCGIGTGNSLLEAFNRAYDSDPVSIFGGIIAFNQEVDGSVADRLSHIFLEVIIAPRFTEEALALLSQKKNLRLLEIDDYQTSIKYQQELTSVLGGVLVQDSDDKIDAMDDWKVVTDRQPTESEKQALLFAWRAVKHVKSNAIVISTNTQTLGIGAGQMNRVGSVAIALEQVTDKVKDAVLASDAFFPMSDSVELAGEKGIKAIIQPGGSIKDQESIDMANKYGMTMIMTGIRHFKH
ncbi:MAG: bifunctional phosphoribosylaminoimidazolecarboxamide formyltransferase/IMP cyclohydrolase [Vagococcus sp.]